MIQENYQQAKQNQSNADTSPGVLLALAIIIILEIFLIMNYHPHYEWYFDLTIVLLFCFGAYWAYYLLMAMRKTPKRVCKPITDLRQYSSYVMSQRQSAIKKLYQSKVFQEYQKQRQQNIRESKLGGSSINNAQDQDDDFIKQLIEKQNEIFGDD